MAHVRFLVHLLPASAAPAWMGWPQPAPVTEPADEPPPGWYAWRLIMPNNRELARSVFRFAAPELCREAVREIRTGADGMEISTLTDALTGEFGWRAELDGRPVATGRRYENEQRVRYATRRFLDAVGDAEIIDVIRGLRDRHSTAESGRIAVGRQ